MSQGSNSNESVTVSKDGITVDKTVTADEFPVPAVVFLLESTKSEPTHVRLTDEIPESFPMERVGFHPDFESDRWTAYKDHRVEFERDIDPGETVKTVYGIRTDDTSDLSEFLIEPKLKELSPREQEEAADIEGVLGPDNSQLVRDVLSGDRSSLPGVDGEEPADPLGTDADDPLAGATGGASAEADLGELAPEMESEDVEPADPSAVNGDGDGAAVDIESADTAAADSEESAVPEAEPDATDEADPAVDDEEIDDQPETDEQPEIDDQPETDEQPEADEPTTVDDTEPDPEATTEPVTTSPRAVNDDLESAVSATADGDDEDSSSVVAVEGGIAAVLAAELRNGNVSEEDRALLKKELGSGVPRSVEVRLSRVQSQVEDLSAYTDALEEFIDENGTATEIFGDLRSDVEELSSELDEITVDLDSAAAERADLSADLATVRTGVNTVERDLEALDERVAGNEESVDDINRRIQETENTADDAAARVDDLDSSVSKLSRDVETATETAEGAESTASEAANTAETATAEAEEATEAVADLDTDLDHAFDNISDIGETVDDLNARVGDLNADIGGMDDDIVDVQDDMEALDDSIRSIKRRLRADIDDLEETVADVDERSKTAADAGEVDALTDRIEELEAEIEALEQFRNQLSSAFGGVGGGGMGGGDGDN